MIQILKNVTTFAKETKSIVLKAAFAQMDIIELMVFVRDVLINEFTMLILEHVFAVLVSNMFMDLVYQPVLITKSDTKETVFVLKVFT